MQICLRLFFSHILRRPRCSIFASYVGIFLRGVGKKVFGARQTPTPLSLSLSLAHRGIHYSSQLWIIMQSEMRRRRRALQTDLRKRVTPSHNNNDQRQLRFCPALLLSPPDDTQRTFFSFQEAASRVIEQEELLKGLWRRDAKRPQHRRRRRMPRGAEAAALGNT